MGISQPFKNFWGKAHIMFKKYLSLFWGLLYYYIREDVYSCSFDCIKNAEHSHNHHNRTLSATTLYQFMIMLDTSFSDFRHFVNLHVSDELPLSSNNKDILTSLLREFYRSLVFSFLKKFDSEYSFHATYSRYIIVNDFKVSLQVYRVKDNNDKTHAVLPSFLIPYKWYCIDDFLDIINNSHSSPSLNSFSYELKAIMRAVFRKWIKDHSSISTLDLSVIPVSFEFYHIQFLQNASIPNSLLL